MNVQDTKQSLIIVEDDPKLQAMLCEYFEGQGFEVRSIDNGTDAPDAILESQPDLVLLDLMLPGQDGLSVCRLIRECYKGKILMLTASDDDFDHVAALEIGADDFVTKPIKPRVLLARIRMLLRRKEAANADSDTCLEVGVLSLNACVRLVHSTTNRSHSPTVNLTYFGYSQAILNKPFLASGLLKHYVVSSMTARTVPLITVW